MYKERFNLNIKDETKLETQITYIFGMICQLSLASFSFRMFKKQDLIIRRLKKNFFLLPKISQTIKKSTKNFSRF